MKDGVYRFMGVLSGVLVLAGGAAHAESYPSKPIRVIVPFSAGGPTDAMARDLAVRMSKELEQPVVVENRAGAGGNIGAEITAKS
ncbi:Bug family tripartite tricarboxylate transporter substrate binding protein, partial [Burkholderia sp. AW33-5]